jgi:3-oxosteroid 1-dehydrogenase
VLERSGQVGGVTAYSMGEVWVPGNHLAAALRIVDSIENGVRYVNNLSMGYSEDAAVLNQALHAPVAIRYYEETNGIVSAPRPSMRSTIGQWLHRLWQSVSGIGRKGDAG